MKYHLSENEVRNCDQLFTMRPGGDGCDKTFDIVFKLTGHVVGTVNYWEAEAEAKRTARQVIKALNGMYNSGGSLREHEIFEVNVAFFNALLDEPDTRTANRCERDLAALTRKNEDEPADIHAHLAKKRQIAIIWSIEDVQEILPDLNADQAWTVLQWAERVHNAAVGLNWEVLKSHARMCRYNLANSCFNPSKSEGEKP